MSDEGEEDRWALLPYMLMEDIFAQLHHKHRQIASMVCQAWYGVFYSARVWHHIVINHHDFCYRRFNLYRGYQKEFDHRKFQTCLDRVGCNFRSIVINPIPDFYNLGKCLEVLAAYLGFFPEYPMPDFKYFKFTFACECRVYSETTVFGTGGELLEELKNLLRNLRHLKFLSLNHLLLDNKDAQNLLEDFSFNCGSSLTILELINATKVPCLIPQVTLFDNLQQLVISPQNINDESLIMLAQSSVCELVIVQDSFTPETLPVVASTWIEVKEMAPYFRVRFEVRNKAIQDFTLQPRAPVHAIVYETAFIQVHPGQIVEICDHYKKYLEVYGHQGLPKVHGSRSFHERADSHLVYLVQQCPQLHTLMIRERVSTATLLIIASVAKNLKKLIVRRNAVMKKCDWPKNMEWSDSYYRWLQENALSYENTEKEVSKILKSSWPWRTLSDWEFKRYKI